MNRTSQEGRTHAFYNIQGNEGQNAGHKSLIPGHTRYKLQLQEAKEINQRNANHAAEQSVTLEAIYITPGSC